MFAGKDTNAPYLPMTDLPLNYQPHNAFAHFFRDPKLAPFLYALSQNMAEGHICLNIKELQEDPEYWEAYAGQAPKNPEFPGNSSLVTYNPDANSRLDRPFVVYRDALYTARFFQYEQQIGNRLRVFNQPDPHAADIRQQLTEHRESIQQQQAPGQVSASDTPDLRADWQLVAAIRACASRLTIVTGGPGTGKTTALSKILHLLRRVNPEIRIALAAPTGKAAERMGQALSAAGGQEFPAPVTIHKLLGASIDKSRHNTYGAEKTLPYDAVIIDETSMVGVSLFTQLLHALHPEAKLILLGDVDQLFSVEAGNLFGDLCALLKPIENRFSEADISWMNDLLLPERRIPETFTLNGEENHGISFIRLQKTYRYDPNSDIGRYTAAMIRPGAGHMPELSNDGSLEIASDDLSGIIKSFSEHYHPYLSEKTPEAALKAFSEVRILCATRQTRYGTAQINTEIAGLLGRYAQEKKLDFKPTGGFYANQPIMVTRNQKDPVLNNGDVGVLRRNQFSGNLMAHFLNDNPESAYTSVHPAMIASWEPVFAMTIHKCQGSEFNYVLVVLPPDPNHRILSTELLYTAMTRVKRDGKLLLYAAEAVLRAIPFRRMVRISGLSRQQLILP